jgi:hypothetical protein
MEMTRQIIVYFHKNYLAMRRKFFGGGGQSFDSGQETCIDAQRKCDLYKLLFE